MYRPLVMTSRSRAQSRERKQESLRRSASTSACGKAAADTQRKVPSAQAKWWSAQTAAIDVQRNLSGGGGSGHQTPIAMGDFVADEKHRAAPLKRGGVGCYSTPSLQTPASGRRGKSEDAKGGAGLNRMTNAKHIEENSDPSGRKSGSKATSPVQGFRLPRNNAASTPNRQTPRNVAKAPSRYSPRGLVASSAGSARGGIGTKNSDSSRRLDAWNNADCRRSDESGALGYPAFDQVDANGNAVQPVPEFGVVAGDKIMQSHYSGTTTPTSVSDASLSFNPRLVQEGNPADIPVAVPAPTSDNRVRPAPAPAAAKKQDKTAPDSRILNLIGKKSVLSRSAADPTARRYRQYDILAPRNREDRRPSTSYGDDAEASRDERWTQEPNGVPTPPTPIQWDKARPRLVARETTPPTPMQSEEIFRRSAPQAQARPVEDSWPRAVEEPWPRPVAESWPRLSAGTTTVLVADPPSIDQASESTEMNCPKAEETNDAAVSVDVAVYAGTLVATLDDSLNSPAFDQGLPEGSLSSVSSGDMAAGAAGFGMADSVVDEASSRPAPEANTSGLTNPQDVSDTSPLGWRGSLDVSDCPTYASDELNATQAVAEGSSNTPVDVTAGEIGDPNFLGNHGIYDRHASKASEMVPIWPGVENCSRCGDGISACSKLLSSYRGAA